MWLIAYVIGALEMGLITGLIVKVITSGGWLSTVNNLDGISRVFDHAT
ncbi:hypothetical protein [Propionivibrio sp.]